MDKPALGLATAVRLFKFPALSGLGQLFVAMACAISKRSITFAALRIRLLHLMEMPDFVNEA